MADRQEVVYKDEANQRYLCWTYYGWVKGKTGWNRLKLPEFHKLGTLNKGSKKKRVEKTVENDHLSTYG